MQCLNTSHCQSGNCNLATHTCAGDACSVCADPYPACVEIGGQFTCVQCTPPKDGDPGNFAYCEDKGADCVNQACCDANTYTCLGITQVVGTCKTDADCPGTSTSGGTLKCDTASQACYDPDGFCDGVMSQCPSGNCISLLDSMMGGGGGIPGMPGGGMPGGPGIPGFCGCTVGGTDCTPGSTCVDLASTQLGQMLPMFTDPVCINCDGVSKMFGGGMISMLCTLIVAGGGGGIPLPGFP